VTRVTGVLGASTTSTVQRLRRSAAVRAGVRRWARAQEVVRGTAHEAGMATAEYAIATVAAVGFAGLLVVILRSTEVRGLLTGIIRGALST